jgi:hypothetical protein
MKPTLVWFLLSLPTLVCRADDTTPIKIRIDCSPDHRVCGADPSYLQYSQQSRIEVISPFHWQCSVYLPSGKSQSGPQQRAECPVKAGNFAATTPLLVFTPSVPADGDPAEARATGPAPESTLPQVLLPVLIATKPDSYGIAGLALAGAAALFGLASAVLSLVLWKRAGGLTAAQAVADEHLGSRLEEFRRDIQQILTDLQFEALPAQPAPRGSVSGARATLPPVAAAPPDETPLENLRQFLECLDNWTMLARAEPPEIGKLRFALVNASPGVSAAEVREVVETVVQVAVRCTDDAFDPGGANADLQAALGRLIEASGLTVIQPQPRDAFDDNRHTAMGNKHAPSPQLRWRIAAVRRRGLERAGKVVAKAEVSVFD